MKKNYKLIYIISLSFLIMIIGNCKKDDVTQPCADPYCGCPGLTGEVKELSKYFYNPKVSSFQNKVAFLTHGGPKPPLNIWDKRTNQIQMIEISNKFQDSIQYGGINDYSWCPYDESKLMLNITTYTDTVGDKKKYWFGTNLYILNLKNLELEKVSPSVFGRVGHSSTVIWLNGSTLNNDSIQLINLGLYLLQKDMFIFDDIKYNYEIQSNNEKYFLGKAYNQQTSMWGINLNGKNIMFPDSIVEIFYISISPNSENIALSVLPRDTTNNPKYHRYFEIWIVKISDIIDKTTITNKKIINLRKEFCRFANQFLNAGYSSNNSLVLSMYKEADDIAPLFEISLNGKIIRQITDK